MKQPASMTQTPDCSTAAMPAVHVQQHTTEDIYSDSMAAWLSSIVLILINEVQCAAMSDHPPPQLASLCPIWLHHTHRHNYTMDERPVVGFCGQLDYCN